MRELREVRAAFRRQGFVNLGVCLTEGELERFRLMYRDDRHKYGYFWHKYGFWQHANYDALVSSPSFDEIVRHPRVYPLIRHIMSCDDADGEDATPAELCFGEIGLRLMRPRRVEDGGPAVHRQWHRDRPHWSEHPLRVDYLQVRRKRSTLPI